MGTGVAILALESDIQDQQRIIAADEAILALEKSPERRGFLLNEIAAAEERIEKLRRQIENLRHPY